MFRTRGYVRGGTAVVALALAGCTSEPSDDFGFETAGPGTTGSATTGDTGGPTGEPGTGSDGSGGSGGSTGGGSTGGGIKLDVPDGSGTGPTDTGQDGCGAVDFLFVIDNSASMAPAQSSLIASFPAFIDAIETTLDVQNDFHILVTDVDAWPFEICPTYGTLCPTLCPEPGYTCDDPNTPQDESSQPGVCEDVLGAGLTHPRGQGASNQDCSFASGARYMDGTEPDLAGTFACAAQVGTLSKDVNDPEVPMESMLAALSASGDAADCNTGFLRDDAILVVTFITDENDDAANGSAGTPQDWFDGLVAAKNGNAEAVVTLGVFGQGSGCSEDSPRLDTFVDLFGARGFKGDICAGSYEQFFLDAVGTIDTTCDDFVPPG